MPTRPSLVPSDNTGVKPLYQALRSGGVMAPSDSWGFARGLSDPNVASPFGQTGTPDAPSGVFAQGMPQPSDPIPTYSKSESMFGLGIQRPCLLYTSDAADE